MQANRQMGEACPLHGYPITTQHHTSEVFDLNLHQHENLNLATFILFTPVHWNHHNVFKTSTSKVNSKEKSPWEGNSHSASQGISHHLQNPNVQYHVHKIRPMNHILRHINPVYILEPYLSSILLLSPIYSLDLPSDLFLSGCLTNILHPQQKKL